MSNGCGCQSGILRYVKPPYAGRFYVPCCIHDDDYDKGGTKRDRKIADVRLYKNMLKRSDNWKHRTVAIFYYASVRLFGRLFFNFK